VRQSFNKKLLTYLLTDTTFPLLCDSSRGYLRFYNRREPQEATNIRPRRPRMNLTGRNQNLNLPRDSRSLPPTKIFAKPHRTAA